MPRVKCHFCDERVTTKPSILKNKSHYMRCIKCRSSVPKGKWRCKAINTAYQVKGERCKNWVGGIGHEYCVCHTRKVKKNEASIDN